MPPDHPGWTQLRARAAAQLPGDFADRVLRAARLEVGSPEKTDAFTGWLNLLVMSAGTLLACLFAVVAFHAHSTHAANERHLADWLAISSQSVCLAETP